MMLPLGRMTWGPLLIFCLFLHGVFTLMQFCVSPVSAMPYCSMLVGWFPLHVVLIFLNFAECSELSSLLVQFKLLVGGPNHQRPYGRPKLLHHSLVVAVASALWPGLLLLHSDPGWPPAP